jgi:hypothetical protein
VEDLEQDQAEVIEESPAEVGDQQVTARSSRPGLRDSARSVRRFWRRRAVRRTRRAILAAFLVFLVVVGWSIAGALTAPGTDPTSVRLAEWGRDHGFGGMIDWFEKVQYEHNQPRIGGMPAGGIPRAAGAVAPSAPGRTKPAGPHILPAPPSIPVLAAGAPLPGEGQWQTVVTVKGAPAVRVAALRPDDQHTSFVVGVMWIDPNLVRGQLEPGYLDPGSSWQAASPVTAAMQSSMVAAFNAGFRFYQSHGGYYSAGKTAAALRDNAASLVLDTDGRATVGSWNNEVRMTPDVASVRQNLVMLVDNGDVSPSCSSGSDVWGATVGNAAFINRSGFGVTANGGEVFVAGPALSVCTLGNILQAVGVVRGMELDINPAWVNGAYFHDQPTGLPQGFALYPNQKTPPSRYFTPTSRDWFGWYARP